MDKLTLNAQLRTVTGRKVKTLRKEGFLPANIFGKKVKSRAVSVKLADFVDLYKKAGETSLVTLEIGDGKQSDERAVLVSNIQYDPVTDRPLHVDFHQVDLKEKVSANVPVEVVGESPAEKQAIGTVVNYIDEIEVEALPTDLPEKFLVDISNLTEVDQQVLVKDLDYDKKKVEVKVGADEIVVKVEPPQKEEVVAPAAPAEAVGPEGAVKPEAEGETVAEGEKPKEEKTSEVKEEGK
jgi:large subunit ribosomal protein L25